MDHKDNWDQLNEDVISCKRCPRLVQWREQVAKEKRKAFLDEQYWGNPVPGFGDLKARVLVIGLAPGAHGSNRTGRMFTGDASGDFLFPALCKAGFSSQGESRTVGDGLRLKNMYITAVCRCVPPGNRPTIQEQQNCLPFLKREIALLKNLQGIVALGGIAFKNAFNVMRETYSLQSSKRPKFVHGRLILFEESPLWLLASYHPSRQNTQTGRLTEKMFSDIWKKANYLLEELKS